VYVTLYQNNLSSLQETNVIDYRERDRKIHATAGTYGVAMLIRALEVLCSDAFAEEQAKRFD